MRRGLVRAVRAVSAALAVALVLGACVAARPVAPTSIPTQAREAVPSRNLVVAPDLPFVLYQGAAHFGGREPNVNALLANGKPLVLNFWGGLCPPCRSELPEFQKVYEQYGGRVAFFGLDVGQYTGLGSPDDAKKLLAELHITYPAGTTDIKEVLLAYEVRGLPTTFFINAEGKIVERWSGQLSGDKLAELVAGLISGSASQSAPIPGSQQAAVQAFAGQ
jgi:thiol-disulfide isomerase/thioredoxin